MKRFSALAGSVAAVLATAVAVAPSTPAAATAPTIYAHRGGANEAPENTLGAFRQSVARYGTDVWLEMDVQLTSDRHLVVIHDATLNRTTDCEGAVSAKALADVQACDASKPFPGWGAVEPVPAFRDVLAEAKANGWRIMPEIKNIPGEPNFDPTGEAAADQLAYLVGDEGFPLEDLVVQSFFPTSLEVVKARNPHIDVALLTTSTLPAAPTGVGFLASENAVFSAARGYEVSAPDARSLDMSAETVAAARLAGREVVVWTVDDVGRAQELAGFGVDGIITNAPGLLLANL